MTVDQALARLRVRGKARTAAIYRRHGADGEVLGASYAELDVLARALGPDLELATALWDSGVHDARVLATKLAPPAQIARTTLARWLRACRGYVLVDAVAALAARGPAARALADAWSARHAEWTAAAGWNVYASLALAGGLDARTAKTLLGRIRREIGAAPNRTRHAMNGALIAIGGAMPAMTRDALAVARALGTVEVDHGETGCTTPDAAGYIARMAARRRARGG